MKQTIMLDDGTRVEIDGTVVKHIGADGSVLYDTAVVSSDAEDASAISHFFLMGEPERKKVAEWFSGVNPKVGKNKKSQRNFLERVGRALQVINYDYYIATLEPSFDECKNIFYKKGMPVAGGIKLGEWEKRVANFYSDAKWHSELAILEEGDLFKAYRIAMGYWTLEYVCDNSSTVGNYWNTPNSAHDLEVSGARKVGGFRDGIGNTSEIYHTETGFAIVGGIFCTKGDVFPVADVIYDFCPDTLNLFSVGVVVIKRSNH